MEGVRGPDSQYPVENSTETAHWCGYRKGYRSRACAHEGRKMSFLFIYTYLTHTHVCFSLWSSGGGFIIPFAFSNVLFGDSVT